MQIDVKDLQSGMEVAIEGVKQFVPHRRRLDKKGNVRQIALIAMDGVFSIRWYGVPNGSVTDQRILARIVLRAGVQHANGVSLLGVWFNPQQKCH